MSALVLRLGEIQALWPLNYDTDVGQIKVIRAVQRPTSNTFNNFPEHRKPPFGGTLYISDYQIALRCERYTPPYTSAEGQENSWVEPREGYQAYSDLMFHVGGPI